MGGGITFALVYIGGGKNSSGDSTPREVPTLTFGDKKYPPPGAPALISEVNQQGTQAFWFTNAGPDGQALTGNVLGSRARMARAFGVPPEKLLGEIMRRLRNKPEYVELTSAQAPVPEDAPVG